MKVCIYCNHDATLTDIGMHKNVIVCRNPDCSNNQVMKCNGQSEHFRDEHRF